MSSIDRAYMALLSGHEPKEEKFGGLSTLLVLLSKENQI